MAKRTRVTESLDCYLPLLPGELLQALLGPGLATLDTHTLLCLQATCHAATEWLAPALAQWIAELQSPKCALHNEARDRLLFHLAYYDVMRSGLGQPAVVHALYRLMRQAGPALLVDFLRLVDQMGRDDALLYRLGSVARLGLVFTDVSPCATLGELWRVTDEEGAAPLCQLPGLQAIRGEFNGAVYRRYRQQHPEITAPRRRDLKRYDMDQWFTVMRPPLEPASARTPVSHLVIDGQHLCGRASAPLWDTLRWCRSPTPEATMRWYAGLETRRRAMSARLRSQLQDVVDSCRTLLGASVTVVDDAVSCG